MFSVPILSYYETGKHFTGQHWFWDQILIDTDLDPYIDAPRESWCIPVWDSPGLKNRAAAYLERSCTWIISCKEGSLFKVSVCSGRFRIKQHLIASLENHGRSREMYPVTKSCVLYLHHTLGFHALTAHRRSHF